MKELWTFLTLIWVGGGIILHPPPSPCWFFLNNSETVKAVTLAFSIIFQHLISDIRAKFDIHYSSQSPDIGKNSGRSISDFWISRQSLINVNCHNSRTSDDTDMKLSPITKRDKKDKATSKKFCDDVMSENCHFSDLWPIYGQSGSWIPDASL